MAEVGSLRFWGPGLLSTSPAFSMSSASHSAGSSGWLAQKTGAGPTFQWAGKVDAICRSRSNRAKRPRAGCILRSTNSIIIIIIITTNSIITDIIIITKSIIIVVVVVVVVDPTPPTCCQQSLAPESCGCQQSLPPGGKERLNFVGIRPEVQARKGGW